MKREITDTQGSRDRELCAALEHAQQLSDSRPAAHSPAWSYAAAHVGDLAVLALAFRD